MSAFSEAVVFEVVLDYILLWGISHILSTLCTLTWGMGAVSKKWRQIWRETPFRPAGCGAGSPSTRWRRPRWCSEAGSEQSLPRWWWAGLWSRRGTLSQAPLSAGCPWTWRRRETHCWQETPPPETHMYKGTLNMVTNKATQSSWRYEND